MNRRNINSSSPSETGFSLLDVLVSFFILAVLTGLFSQAVMNMVPKYQLQKGVWGIHSCLSYARYRALFQGVKIRVKFDSASCIIEKYDENEKKWKAVQSSFFEGISLQANNSPIFHPRGTVSNLASIYISNSSGKYRITLAISGRVRVLKIQQ